jgi:putative membrane protein
MSPRSSNDVAWLSHFNAIPFKKNRPLHLMIIVFVIVWVISAIHPVKWTDWLLDNAVLVLCIGMLALLYRTFAFRNISYFFITLFFILHVMGAHYTYQKTPFDDWINILFHTKRAMYDRIVHFAFGLLLALPVLEVTVRVMKLRSVWAYAVTFAVLLASGALFEILEMLGALLAGDEGEKYLGLQGDPMDTSKDMAMNLIGSLLSIGLIRWFSHLQHRKR